MNLYILRQTEGDKELHKQANFNPSAWEPWYDKTHGFIINASNELAARSLAADDCGDEGRLVWLSPSITYCKLLVSDNIAGVIMSDFYAA